MDFRLGAQLSADPLISNEQYGLGGIDTVRGYIESIELADSGVNASIELRSPTWSFGSNAANNHIGTYIFYDAAYASIQQPLADQQSSFVLEGMGLGVRFIFFKYLDGMLEVADPLHSVSTAERGHPRIEFQVHFGM
jgi:hemolysin activation/secretion protein